MVHAKRALWVTLVLAGLATIITSHATEYLIGTDDVFRSLQTRGYCEIGNHHFLKDDYNELYRTFDQFIDLMSNDRDFAIKIHTIEKDFLSIDTQKKRYCSAPPSYRDPREHETKRFNKIYFQFIKEHYNLLCDTETYTYDPSVESFLKNMEKLDAMARELFSEIIDRLEESRPGIKALAYGKYQELTVISKIVRYEKSEGWGTTPHRDKSCISLIWDSNDDDDDSLLLCEDTQNPSFKKLKKPIRFFSQAEDVTSTILIPGAACSKAGIDLNPTIHGVAPIKKEYRHAVISFLLIPDIDMSEITSDFIEPSEENVVKVTPKEFDMFFPSAKIVVRHPLDAEKILLVQRNAYYEPAGGKLEIDFSTRTAENLEQCAIREAREELGLMVSIEQYIGSYYFFWSIDPNKFSSCAVFVGEIVAQDPAFITNADSSELRIDPVWVSVNDILDKKVRVDPLYIGLEDLLIDYCRQVKG
jgi:8-oxo-dGTP pyrophosphatase MutT (NUDIX family)